MSRAAWLGNFAQWGSVAVALLALIASGATAYHAVLKQTEELRVTVDRSPWLSYNAEANVFKVGKQMEMMFVNSGSTPIVIRGVYVHVTAERGTGRCHGRSFYTGLEPFVLKEKEIVLRKLTLNVGSHDDKSVDAGDEFELRDLEGFNKEDYEVKLCLYIIAATPSTPYVGGDIELASTRSLKPGERGGAVINPPPMHLIWRRDSLSFLRD